MKSFNLSRWALEHAALTRYLMIVLMFLGVAAYFQLGQDEDPPFTFRVMVVRSYWPGATAQQVAEQVTDKVERVLQETPYADKISSYSKPGESQVIFQIKDNSNPKDVPQTWYTVRKKLGDIRGTLPAGVLGPFFNDEFGDVYGVIYALTGEGFTPAELKREADKVRQRLLQVPDVAKVELFGVQDEKVYVELSARRLASMGIDLNTIIQQLNQQNAVVSAGAFQLPTDQIPIRIQGQFNQVEAIREMPIRVPGKATIRLGDLADIKRLPADPPQVKVRHQGREVIALGLSMAKGGDIIALGHSLAKVLPGIAAQLPVGLRLENVQDQPEAVSRSVNEFLKVLIEAVVIVLGVSFLSLGLHRRPGVHPLHRRWILDMRPGLVVGITIPLVLAVTFLFMHYLGIGLHKISLGSLIIALGLLVDDAIIAVEMMVRKIEEGHDKFRAATFAYELTAMPMLTGTLITAAGFLPIGIAKSVTGEYTFAIFAVTVIALIISWLASVVFVPYLGSLLLKRPEHLLPGRHESTELFDTPFYRAFRKWVTWCVTHRWKTIGLTILLFVLGLVGMGKVQQQFFPDSSRPEILMDIWTPEGSSYAHTEAIALRVEARLAQLSQVESVTTWVGSGVPRFYLPLDQIFPQSNVAQFIVLPDSLSRRSSLTQELPALMAKEFPEVRARVKLLPNGPPVPYPVQFRVSGPSPERLREKAEAMKDLMRANPNTRNVNDNWNESIKTLRLNLDQDKARALGVSSQSIAQALQLQLSGVAVGQYREGDKLLDVIVRSPLNERNQPDALGQLYVPTASGKNIPLSQIAQPQLSWEPGVMWRQGREFAITVQSDVVEGLQGATVTAQLLPALRALEAKWHAAGETDDRIALAGAVEESAKGSASIAAGVPLMLFIVFTLLMIQLQSFSRAMLVFLTGPLGMAGVAGALLALDRPFGFVALLGVIALMGMIQRNSVILIDQIEQDRAQGVQPWQAIVEAAVRRLRPIVLTAAAAVLAMIPLSRSVFWGPMAVAIMGGLIVATALTLLALPAMYAAWFKVPRPER
jgi:multidrug efflux pump